VILTPPQLAAEWRCSPDSIVDLIKSGRLRAFTTSAPSCLRPRWKIPEDAVAEFEAKNRPAKAVKSTRRRRTEPAGFIEYV